MRRLVMVLFLTGCALMLVSVYVVAQEEIDPDRIEYAGSRECRDCHGDQNSVHRISPHALTMVEIEEDMEADENPIVADFALNEDARMTSFADGERAFGMEDIAYTLGAGRNVQAYLTRAEDETLYMLPAAWNVSMGAWQPFALAESWPSEAYAFGPNCASCHTVGLDVSDYTWEEEGVQCESCHGPGMMHVEAADDAGGSVDDEERAEIYGAISLGYDEQTCTQCHGRGTSTDGVHPFAVGYYPGVNDLTSVYSLVSTEDEAHWWSSGHARLPFMQSNETALSGHPNALTTAQESEAFGLECLTCHSATQGLIEHRMSNEDVDPATIDPMALLESNPLGVTCISCHDPHPEELEDAEVLPVDQLRIEGEALCTSCHSDSDLTDGLHYPTTEMFTGQTIIETLDGVPSVHFAAEDGPTCTTCHMPSIPTDLGERNSHTFHIIAPGDVIDNEVLQDSCSTCHTEGAAQLQDLMDDLQTSTRARVEAARAAITDTTPEWVTLALDFIEGDGSEGIHNYAYADLLLDSVEIELGLFAD